MTKTTERRPAAQVATIPALSATITQTVVLLVRDLWLFVNIHQSHPFVMAEVLEKSTTVVARPQFKSHYDNFIGGKWVAPVKGQYFDNPSPIDGKAFCKVARSSKEDIELALDAAHDAFKTWSKASAAVRSGVLLKIADIMEANLPYLAAVETVENGKAIRETMAADLPLCVDHFRYFAGVIRAEEGSATELNENTLSLVIQEPLGVIGQIIPWNFPLLMATWKIAPALAAGCCVVVKPAEQTPASIMVLMELIQDVVPGRAERGERLRPGSRQAVGQQQARAEGVVHGRDDHRPPHPAIRRRKHHPRDDGAGRQVAQHLLQERDGPRR